MKKRTKSISTDMPTMMRMKSTLKMKMEVILPLYLLANPAKGRRLVMLTPKATGHRCLTALV